MPDFIFPPPRQVSLPIAGIAARFPVRRIYGIGRNYAEHAREMGHDPARELPFYFQKNADDIVTGGAFPYPAGTNDVHHEIELVVALERGGKDIPADRALDGVYGYAVGLDMTRRDLQGAAKKAGRPWEIAKAFDASAPMGEIVPATVCGHPAKGAITLEINGERRQTGDLSDLIWSVPELIAHISSQVTLAPGDLIMTGTPAGVGPVQRGDVLEGRIEGVGTLSVTVV